MLEKNREERRARQAEIKEEKKALMNLDPGNVIIVVHHQCKTVF